VENRANAKKTRKEKSRRQNTNNPRKGSKENDSRASEKEQLKSKHRQIPTGGGNDSLARVRCREKTGKRISSQKWLGKTLERKK